MPSRTESSQKFIERNRAPRVQISYDVDLYGDEKIELPFVMGVLADLSGKYQEGEDVPSIADRKFLEFDVDNFDKKMETIKPRAAFVVPNLLSDSGGNMAVDVSFTKMSDFTPEAIAKQVEPLRKLLETRTQLKRLLSYMDGKSGAEQLLEKLLHNPALMKSVMETPMPKVSESDDANS